MEAVDHHPPPGDDPGVGPSLEKAVTLALAHLNRRERSVAEVRAHLARQGVSETTAAAAVEELLTRRLLDDSRFAAMFIADKRNLEQWGSGRIRRGLAERGVDRELAERSLVAADTDAIDGSGLGETELDRALALLRRRFPEAPRERRERDRALGMLLRKGYEIELACDALAAHARGG